MGEPNGNGSGRMTWERIASVVGGLLLLVLGMLWGGHESRISALEEDAAHRRELVARIDENVKHLMSYFGLQPRTAPMGGVEGGGSHRGARR